MQFFVSLIIFFVSSAYVLLLSYIALSPEELQRAIVLPIVITAILLVLYRPKQKSWKEFMGKWGKLFFLFWGTAFVQLLVLSSGGLQSPFLILVYLFMMAISFIFSFPLAVIFLCVSLAIIFINLSFHQNILSYLLHDPSFTVLHIVSLIPIIPLAYLISRQYHLRDMLFSSLHIKVKTDEAIMEHLRELIIITDPNLIILSVNDAVEQALQKSRSELLGHDLFNILFLRDANDKLVTKETFFPNGDTAKSPINTNAAFSLFLTSVPHREVNIQIQSTKGIANQTSQISFILWFTQAIEPSKNILTTSLEKTRAKYEAISEYLLQELGKTNFTNLQTQALLMREIESDMYHIQILQQYPGLGIISNTDTAKLVKHTVDIEQEFAKIFHVTLNFSLKNFGKEDIAPLTVKSYPISPEQLTGPFFTVKTDLRRFELLIKKLLDVAVLLASGQQGTQIPVSIQRGDQETVILTIMASCAAITPDELSNLFLPYYGKLSDTTPLHAGSGLEGFLAKSACNALSYKLDTNYSTDPAPQVTFTLTITKNLHVAGAKTG